MITWNQFCEMQNENHSYLRKTSRRQEKKLQKANVLAMQSSGHPQFGYLDQKRKDIIKNIENQRPLRRSEFIDLYGYEAWIDYAEKYGIPEDSKWADAHI